jgi:MFS family permease
MNSHDGQAEQLERVYSKVFRRIMPLLMIAYITAYLDRVNVGFAKLQMLADLGFSEAVYGLGAGIFFLGYFVFGLPSNMMLHRVGPRVWIAGIMIAWGIVSGLTSLVRTPGAYYALRFLLGVAEAGFFPGIIFYLTQWYPDARRGKATAIFMTGIAICSVIGSLLSGWIMQAFDGAYGWAGWQWLFPLEAIPAVLVGVWILLALHDDIASAPWLNESEKSLLRAELVHRSGPKPTESPAAAFRDGRVWLACFIYFCAMTGLYGVGFWLPTIISEMGITSLTHIGMLAAIPYAVAAVGMVLVARSADRHNERRWHVAIPAALGAAGLVVSVLFAQDRIIALAALAVSTFGILTAAPLFWSLPTAYLRGAAAAAGIAIINSCGNLAGFLSPYVIGWIKDATRSTAVGMYYVATFLLIGAVLVIVGIPRREVA